MHTFCEYTVVSCVIFGILRPDCDPSEMYLYAHCSLLQLQGKMHRTAHTHAHTHAHTMNETCGTHTHTHTHSVSFNRPATTAAVSPGRAAPHQATLWESGVVSHVFDLGYICRS